MRRLLHQHPDIALKLLSAFAERLREANERISRQSFQTVASRVAAVLIQQRPSSPTTARATRTS